MKRGGILAATLVAAFSMLAIPSSKASIIVSIGLQEAGFSGGAIMAAPAPVGGVVSYGTFTIQTLDLSGPADLTSPSLLFGEVSGAKSTSSGTLNVFFTVQGLTVPSSGVVGLLSDFDALIPRGQAGSIVDRTFIDPLNGLFQTSKLISTSPTYTSGSNSSEFIGFLGGLAPGSTYSLTEELTFTATAAGQRFQSDVNVAAVPEPTTWALMGIGFACLGFLAYRRKGHQPSFRIV